MLNRKFAAVAIAASVLVGTTGCTFISPVATLKVYTPGDGTDVNFGDVAARNIFILVAPSGQTALFGSLVNQGDSANIASLTIAGQTYSLNLNAGEKLDIGYNGQNALSLGGFTAKAGSLVDVTFKTGTDSVDKTVPVLDGTFAQYAPLVNSMGVIAPTAAPKG